MTTAQVVAKIARGEVISAIKHTHIRNLHSLVLEERKDELAGMTRIYFADEGHGMKSLIKYGEFVLMPHCHRQDITLHKLFGEVGNVKFYSPIGSINACQYVFNSPILGGVGELKMQFSDRIGFPLVTDMEDQVIELPYHAIHSMVVDSPTAAWIVREGQTAPSGYNPPCWSMKPDRVLDMTGMYQPATRDEIDDMCRRIIHAI